MKPIDLAVREHLSEETKSSTKGISEIQSFCEEIDKDSLNLKVHGALASKNRGHFDEAMLDIAEANRDQVTAIRNIQKLMGQARGERFPEVVFEKFRQFEPFEIGISDADDVLSILADLDDGNDPQLKENRLELHDCELRRKDEVDYLSFLEDRLDEGGASEEGIKARASLVSLAQALMKLRGQILKKIFVVVGKALNEMPSGIERDRIFLKLSQNAFLIVTSPILTKPARQVETEK